MHAIGIGRPVASKKVKNPVRMVAEKSVTSRVASSTDTGSLNADGEFLIVGVGYYRPLLPIFAKDILFVGPAGFGMLSSAPAVGGVLGTIALLMFGDIKNKGLLALSSFLSYALALGIFAVSTDFFVSLSLLGVLGLANSLQAVMRQTSFHLLTPDHLRGRAFSVFNMFSQGANAVGAAEVGFMAALIGTPGSLLLGCVIGAALTLSCWAFWPGLRTFSSDIAASNA